MRDGKGSGGPDGDQEQMRLYTYLRDNGPNGVPVPTADRWSVQQALRREPHLTRHASDGIERFLARTTVLPDGRPLMVVNGTFKGTLNGIAVVAYISWGSYFGNCLRAVCWLRPHPVQAVMVPGDAMFEALKARRVLLVATMRGGKLAEVQSIDYGLAGQPVANALDGLLRVSEEGHASVLSEPDAYPDTEMLMANSVSETFQSYFTRLDWLQLGWIKSCRWRFRQLVEVMDRWDDQAWNEDTREFLGHYRALTEALNLMRGEGSVEQVRKALRFLAEPANALELSSELSWLSMDADGPSGLPLGVQAACSGILHLWNALQFTARLSHWGRSRLYLDNDTRQLSAYDIDYENLTLASPDEAEDYWQYLLPDALIDARHFLEPFDMPEDPKRIADAWRKLMPQVDVDEARKSAINLLDEASAMRRWTIPPKARLELRAGPFSAVEVTEGPVDVHFKWMTENGRYWNSTVGVAERSFAGSLLTADDAVGPAAEWSINLLMAAIIRDFWVSEERRRIFDVSFSRGSAAKHAPAGTRIVYLPRIRYVAGEGIRFDELRNELRLSTRSEHLVRPFIRKTGNPSALQLELARRERFAVPTGHTFVRGHYRGGGGAADTIYRSRSALGLLFGMLEPRPEILAESDVQTTDWFSFEQTTATLLEAHLGFKVLHRAVRGKGDNGVDILAARQDGGRVDELVLVQCKCYGPDHPVGPSTMREMLGSLQDIKREDGQSVRGMVVTTGRISGDALRLAAKHGIQTFDGSQLAAICNAINRAAL